SSTRILCHVSLLGRTQGGLHCGGFRESSTRFSACASGSIPRRVSLGLVITKPIPTVAGNAIQIVYHNPIVNRQLVQQPEIPSHASAVGIDKTELALLDTKDGDIRECAHRDRQVCAAIAFRCLRGWAGAQAWMTVIGVAPDVQQSG